MGHSAYCIDFDALFDAQKCYTNEEQEEEILDVFVMLDDDDLTQQFLYFKLRKKDRHVQYRGSTYIIDAE